jgi:hypothetical protein
MHGTETAAASIVVGVLEPMRPEAEIYCPVCAYRPKPEDRWYCSPGCGACWNTFWTHGVCPGCGHQWIHTQCLACSVISPHEAWYHFPNDPDAAERKQIEKEEIRET